MKLVEITWRDSYSLDDDDWLSTEELEAGIKDVIITTSGYLYKVNDKYIVVVNSRSSLSYYWGAMVIAKNAIIKARELK